MAGIEPIGNEQVGIAERTGEYPEPVRELFTLGDPHTRGEPDPERACDYRALGLDERHAAELIRMACDLELSLEEFPPQAYAPLHAWRALGQFRCAEAAEPLIGLLCELGDVDDWAADDLPIVLGMIGPPAVPRLTQLARGEVPEDVRPLCFSALRYVGAYHPEHAPQMVETLAGVLAGFARESPETNANLICELLKLEAVAAAETLERAFASGRVDEGICGTWEEARRDLGVPGMGIVTANSPRNPNSLLASRERLFSRARVVAAGLRPFDEVVRARRKAQGKRKRRRRH